MVEHVSLSELEHLTSEPISAAELDKLRSLLPPGLASLSLSQLDIILEAIEYIKTLQGTLGAGGEGCDRDLYRVVVNESVHNKLFNSKYSFHSLIKISSGNTVELAISYRDAAGRTSFRDEVISKDYSGEKRVQ